MDGYGETALIGWMLTFMCLGFFALGYSQGLGKKDDGGISLNSGYLFLGLTGVCLVIWFIVF